MCFSMQHCPMQPCEGNNQSAVSTSAATCSADKAMISCNRSAEDARAERVYEGVVYGRPHCCGV